MCVYVRSCARVCVCVCVCVRVCVCVCVHGLCTFVCIYVTANITSIANMGDAACTRPRKGMFRTVGQLYKVR